MKINRLLEITMVLLNRKAITAGELADRFQVSTRTIYRDVDILSVAGVPFQYDIQLSLRCYMDGTTLRALSFDVQYSARE